MATTKTILLFAITLLVAVVISERARRSVLSTAVLFLLTGVVFGHGLWGVLPKYPDKSQVEPFIELALFSVLFTDGMRVGLKDLSNSWRLPVRALLIGLPLTLLLIGLGARTILGLPWTEAFLVGAVLSPTDPVFAAAVIGREEVPRRLRHLLNVESGLNDGLALPIVIVALAMADQTAVNPGKMVAELVGGIGIGILVPWCAIRLERLELLESSEPYRPLLLIAVAAIVHSVTRLLHANGFLAAFAAGITVATTAPDLRDRFHELGELLAELGKLSALLLFGSLLDLEYLRDIGFAGWVFVVLVLVLARPLAIWVSLAGGGLNRREWLAAAWFGPKGFASVFFAFLVLGHGLARGTEIFHLLAVTVAASIIAHSSTDVLVARWFSDPGREPPTSSS